MPRRTLLLVRVAWLGLFALGVAILLFGLPAEFQYLQSPCRGAACGVTQQLSPEQMQELARLGLSSGFYAFFSIAQTLAATLVFVVIAAVIFWRKPDDRMALLCSFTLLLWGFGGPANSFNPPNSLLTALVQLYQAAGNASIVLFLFLFPDGRFFPRWTRWVAPFAMAREVLNVFWDNAWVSNLFLVVAPLILLLQIYRYRRVSNAILRQQTKWVVFGVTVGVSTYVALLLSLFFVTSPGKPPSAPVMMVLVTGLNLSLLLIPISIGLAIVRSRLWDIDILIRRTLVYSALTVILGAVYLASIVILQELLRALTGQGSDLAIIVSTLAIAALFNPLRRRIQNAVDRRFYRRKYDAQEILAQFAASARDEVELDKLTGELVAVVEETMQPASVSLWLRGPR